MLTKMARPCAAFVSFVLALLAAGGVASAAQAAPREAAAPPAAAAAPREGKPAATGAKTTPLSNETSDSRWAYPARVATVRAQPSRSARRSAALAC